MTVVNSRDKCRPPMGAGVAKISREGRRVRICALTTPVVAVLSAPTGSEWSHEIQRTLAWRAGRIRGCLTRRERTHAVNRL